jgi:kynurenine formamidase
MSSARRRFLLSAAAFGGAALTRSFARSASASPEASEFQADPKIPQAQATPVESVRPDISSREAAQAMYAERRNWGRWGADDQLGAVNLLTREKRANAAALVTTGRTVSLSRVFEPEQHFVQLSRDRGFVVDYYGFMYHGLAVTHVDALCHVWDEHGLWNGRNPDKELDTRGAQFGDITAFADGLITRGVLLDVPRHRGQPYVTLQSPVHGNELEAVARAERVELRPGDALLVYSGREAFERSGGTYGGSARPGLHVSCAQFIRDRDVAVLGWDMLDAQPDALGLRWGVHGVIPSFGVALLDNALLEPLATACAEERRYEFMFIALPLKVARGTGSPVNPIAIF